MAFIEITHIDTIEFHRIYLVQSVDTNQIMVSDRMEIIHGDFVSFSPKPQKDFIESIIIFILDGLGFQYLKYDLCWMYLVPILQ